MATSFDPLSLSQSEDDTLILNQWECSVWYLSRKWDLLSW